MATPPSMPSPACWNVSSSDGAFGYSMYRTMVIGNHEITKMQTDHTKYA